MNKLLSTIVFAILLFCVKAKAVNVDLNVAGGLAPSENISITSATFSGANIVKGNTTVGDGINDYFTVNSSTVIINTVWGLTVSTTSGPAGTAIIMFQPTNYRVGIGLRNPDSKLHISSGSLTIDGTLSGVALKEFVVVGVETPTAADIFYNSKNNNWTQSTGTANSWQYRRADAAALVLDE